MTVASGGASPSTGGRLSPTRLYRTVESRDAPLWVKIRSRTIACRQNRGPVYKPQYARLPATTDLFDRHTEYNARHNGPRDSEVAEMLATIGVPDLPTLIQETVPAGLEGAAHSTRRAP